MAMKRDRLINLHSNKAVASTAKGVLTSTGDTGLSQGELAVINTTDNEAIVILNSDGSDLVEFAPKKYVDAKIDEIIGTGTTGTTIGDRVNTLEKGKLDSVVAGNGINVTAKTTASPIAQTVSVVVPASDPYLAVDATGVHSKDGATSGKTAIDDKVESAVKDAKDEITSAITQNQVTAANTSVVVAKVTGSTPSTSVKVNVKAGNNALKLDANGLYVDQTALTTYVGKDAVKIADGLAAGEKEVSLAIKAGDKVLVQTADGLAAGLSLVKDASGLKYTLYGSANDTNHKIGEIDIPKDQFLKSASYNPANHKLRFVFETTTGETTTDIDMSDLVDTYTGDGTTIAITSGNVISVVTAPITATTATGIAKIADVKTGLDAKINTIVTGDTSLVITSSSTSEAARPNVKTATVKVNVSSTEGNRLGLDAAGGLFVSNVIDGGTF